ncbi:MAG: 6-phosphogluconolactonase [Bacteroidales bacterium]|nr:6-phosphogluconolactonase [Bacteroidales bacterium]
MDEMKPELKIYSNPSQLAEMLALDFQHYTGALLKKQKAVSVALSGGSTPELLFRRLATYNQYSQDQIHWDGIHFYWGDERCVPPEHAESNFGMAKKSLFRNIRLPENNIHRILGEADPDNEVKRYADEMKTHIFLQNGYPVFDWVFLGLGTDGHTASIFPDQLNLLYAAELCAVAIHPETKQKRITLTGNSLIHAKRLTYLITGETKKEKAASIYFATPEARLFPAYHIRPVHGKFDWYMDKNAAQLIKL